LLAYADSFAVSKTNLYVSSDASIHTCPLAGCPSLSGGGTLFVRTAEDRVVTILPTASDGVFWSDGSIARCPSPGSSSDQRSPTTARACAVPETFAAAAGLASVRMLGEGVIDGNVYFIIGSDNHDDDILATCPTTGCSAGGPTILGTFGAYGTAATVHGGFVYYANNNREGGSCALMRVALR
jgi:hypothetical protein